jgi:PAS domain-containing protein
MTNTIDPVAHWTRQLGGLRQAVDRKRVTPAGDFTESAFALCDSLLRDLAGSHLESDRLREEVRSGVDAWELLFAAMPGACLVTDGVGTIVKANRAAGVLLNLTAKRLVGRLLLVFSDDRVAFGRLLQDLSLRDDGPRRATLAMRPRERKPLQTDVRIVRLNDEKAGLWLWFLTRARDAQEIEDDVLSETDAIPPVG